MSKVRLVIIGNGMVGHRYIEDLVEKADIENFDVTVFCEEPRVAYDRVHLSSYFSHHTADELSLVKEGFYSKHNINVLIGERAITINRSQKIIYSSSGREINYDKLVMATGSTAWVPPIKGNESKDCFVYRTIEDLKSIEATAKRSKSGVIIGGGLLGLEAAGALKALGVETHVIEFSPVLMAEQLDRVGGEQLRQKIEKLGVQVHTSKNTQEIVAQGETARNTLKFADGSQLEVDFIVFSTGIRPQDKLAHQSGLATGRRGGITISDQCVTSDDDVYAIGECASWGEKFFGLVAPGYKMAQVAVDHLLGNESVFEGADMSAKLKLLGVDVGSIGDANGRTPGCKSYVYLDESEEVYKRIIVSEDGKKLLGAVLVGDTSDYGSLLQLKLNDIDLPKHPDALILPAHAGAEKPAMGADSLPDSAVLCSCFDVTKGKIAAAVADGNTTLGEIKAVTKAGTGCGGCLPLIAQVLNAELAKSGIEVKNHLCEHFEYSRQELFHLTRIEGIKTFAELLAKYGKGDCGCEVCKPTVGSIMASCWGEHILNRDHVGLHDTNDNFLGNIQKDGTYSVIPRMPGGEVTPQALAVLANVAEEYNLYTKVTGAQRIGLFGAHKGDLPTIWKKLIAAGYETGQAYAKSLRMAKTCVGSTWCRYGVQDSVGLGVLLENRYKGIRTPHKMKFGVSGCTRECAEAQGKDLGLIATDKGWNMYVCGNGGMNPRHADLLASDLDQDTLLQYIDRFLMFYVRTADKLQRTSVWMDNLDGGIDYLREVVVNDKLGINTQLESDINKLITEFKCEWSEVVESEEQQKRFAHFINSSDHDSNVRFVSARDQHRPASIEEKADTYTITLEEHA
jgi:nitrite reductase (NADH) large subunit